MHDTTPQRKRARGYSLRTQLFLKSSEREPDVESGLSVQPEQQDTIELRTVPSAANSASTHEDTTRSLSDAFEQERIRQGPKVKVYAGERGKIQKKLADLRNLILNVRPYKKSKAGRKIPISIDGDYGDYGDDFATTAAEGRRILLDDRYHKPYVDNRISSARYSPYSFLPKQLYFQFSKVANIYFMTVSILQMIPSWSTTGTYTTIIPLLIFISISIFREGYDDWKRHVQDKRENNKFSKVLISKDDASDDKLLYSLSRTVDQRSSAQLNPSQFDNESNENLNDQLHGGEGDDTDGDEPNSFRNDNTLKKNGLRIAKIKWKNIKVGDIIKLEQDEPVPADIILLTSDGQNENEVFVETMDLDGETNLKSRIPHSKINSRFNTARDLKSFKGLVTIEDPNPDLYNFEGNVRIGEEVFPLGPENVIYRGSTIRNTNNLIGLVIFTGEESKIRMNAIKNPRTKAPKLQKAINLIVCFMVLIVLSLALFSFMGQRILMQKYWDDAWYLFHSEAGVAPTIMSFIIMYNTLIPLSLYVTTEVIKVVQSLFLQWDIDMYHQPSNTPCESRTATILEELGQVSYIFSDKTGTLTDNLMIFRKFSVAGSAWSHEQEVRYLDTPEELYKSVTQQDKGVSTPRGSIDIRGGAKRYTGRPSLASAMTSNLKTPTTQGSEDKPKLKTTPELLRHFQEHPNSILSTKAKFFILSLALCHTCLPKTISEEDDEIEYQSASPDELALVVAARDMGYVVYGKNQRELTIRTYPDGLECDPVDEKYEVLNVVEFSSARKRMSVVVKFPDGRLCMICKGADNIILEKLANSALVTKKLEELKRNANARKVNEANVILQQRLSIESRPRKSFQIGRVSLGSASLQSGGNFIDDIVSMTHRDSQDVDEIYRESRKSLNLQQKQKYNIKSSGDYIENDKLILNEEFVLENTLNHIEEFSTEGLRTLLYSFKWLKQEDYDQWAREYAEAKTSLVNRAEKIETVGGLLENDFELLGATGIEDKLQDGVSESIEKLRRAGIKLWMLTGDKRETAVNIGYSCKLIKDYSTLVVLDSEDEDVTSKMAAAELEIGKGTVAHCVVVIDGATLSDFESDSSILSMFISLCTKTDSVICCRASPSQKAMMVTSIRKLKKDQVTLAIGDGANDIAMIQSADIGIGITGKEGLQAARTSDYSIAQFKYLQKLLLVHGRYNYIRTSKFVLSTFYKELLFYLSQAIFQRNAMFTGTSLYEPWSLSMFNTLFTSLPVLCIGMFEKDLKPATLLAVPELYSKGRLSQAFNLRVFIGWMLMATTTSLLVCFSSWYIWGFSATYDNSLYPMGVLTFTAIVFTINIKVNFLEQHDRTYLNFVSLFISCLGWFLWCCMLPGLYSESTSKIYDVYRGIYWKFGKDITWWASLLIIVAMPLLYDYIVQMIRTWVFPNDVDEFQTIEKNTKVRKQIELAAFSQMQQSWQWKKDDPMIKRYIKRKRQGTLTLDTELPPGAPATVEKNTAIGVIANDGEYETEVLPSGKLIKRRIGEAAPKKMLRFGKAKKHQRSDSEPQVEEEDVDAIIAARMKDLE